MSKHTAANIEREGRVCDGTNDVSRSPRHLTEEYHYEMPMLSTSIPLSQPRPPPYLHVYPGCDFKETSVYACVGVIFSGVQIWDKVSPLNLWLLWECFGKVLLYHGRVEMEIFGGRERALRCTCFDDDAVSIGKMHLLVRCWR